MDTYGTKRVPKKRNKRFHCHDDASSLSDTAVATESRFLLYPTMRQNRRIPQPTMWGGGVSQTTARKLSTAFVSKRPISFAPPNDLPETPPPIRGIKGREIVSPPPMIRMKPPYFCYETIGNPSLGIFRLQLPMDLVVGKLDPIISHAEQFALNLPHGWNTDLYSLTKQDIALREIPGMAQRIRPIFNYISEAIRTLYGARKVVVDENQPHILKYSVEDGHTGVALHHDRCDVTANLALSKCRTYEGGGTFIPDAKRVVKLEQGECLLHPGSLVHGGMEVTKGTRYLMVTFAHLK